VELDFILKTLLAYEEARQSIRCAWTSLIASTRTMNGSPACPVLGKTGVLTGEFGFVEAEGAQRARLERWMEDASE
jgi:hypothetical protein